jgi:enoyl-CoA hydratase
MAYETLRLERQPPLLTVTIDRQHALNALNRQVFEELLRVLASDAQDSQTRVLLLTGAGERAFVAGADIKEMAGLTRAEAEARSWRGMHVYDAMRQHPKPIVAAINGYALGGGMLIALACDIRIAADTAEFGYPEIRLGIFPGTGGTVLINRLIGPAAARAICLLGERFDAARAAQLGLVNQVVPKAELAGAAAAVCDRLAGYSPLTVRELKRALNAALEQDFDAARAIEVEAYGRCFESEDRREGMRAFLEKRAPQFRGD